MSNDPALPLQKAVHDALTGDTFQTACGVAVAVYDRVPSAPAYPYVVIGDDHVAGDLAQGYDGSDVSVTVHVWSRAVGWPEAKAIAGAVRAALESLIIEGHEVVTQSFRDAVYLRDPGTGEQHAVVTSEILTQPAA